MIDVYLFVLAGSIRDSLLVAGATMASWWFLSDYYMAREFSWWTESMDMFVFIPASAAFLLGIIAFRRSRISRSLFLFLPSLALVTDGFEIEIAAWRRVLQELRGPSNVSGAARFLEWQGDRLAALDARRRITPPNVARCWWRAPRTAVRVWLLSLWLPILCVTLVIVPRYTNVMETMAASLQRYQTQIFDVVVSGLLPLAPGAGVPQYRTESVYSLRRNNLQRRDTAFVTNGFIVVRVTDYPRVYRRIKAICSGPSPGCAIVRDPTAAVGLDVDVPVRAGLTRLHFIQTIPDPRLGLKLWLVRWDGGLIDEVGIEP